MSILTDIKEIFLILFVIILILPMSEKIFAQDCDLLYFCSNYENEEVDCSDRFSTGKVTVMARLSNPIFYTKAYIQLDKFNSKTNRFEFYNVYEFDTETDMTYIFFPNILFEEEGIFRVFLLNPDREIITSSLIEII